MIKAIDRRITDVMLAFRITRRVDFCRLDRARADLIPVLVNNSTETNVLDIVLKKLFCDLDLWSRLSSDPESVEAAIVKIQSWSLLENPDC